MLAPPRRPASPLDGIFLASFVIGNCRAIQPKLQPKIPKTERAGLSLHPYDYGPNGGGGEPIELFARDGKVPGESPGAGREERFVNASLTDPLALACAPGDTHGKWFYGVSRPLLVPFIVKDSGKDAAVIVAPGGGFQFLAWHKEGTQIASWLNSIGYNAFVLKYRVPATGKLVNLMNEKILGPAATALKRHSGKALIDGQRAIRWLRHNSGQYNINPERIGVIGFSAGGTLAAELSYTTESQYKYEDEIEAKNYNPRADFALLIYGAGNPYSVVPPMPPTFIAIAENDQCISAKRAEDYAAALQFQPTGAKPELHIFAEGRHGYGDCSMYTDMWKSQDVCSWPANAEVFLQQVVMKAETKLAPVRAEGTP